MMDVICLPVVLMLKNFLSWRLIFHFKIDDEDHFNSWSPFFTILSFLSELSAPIDALRSSITSIHYLLGLYWQTIWMFLLFFVAVNFNEVLLAMFVLSSISRIYVRSNRSLFVYLHSLTILYLCCFTRLIHVPQIFCPYDENA